MTLEDLHALAVAWCPKKARWSHLIEDVQSWGPSHELGHALLETRDRWRRPDYGHCPLAFCECHGALCDTYEVAAMCISRRLLGAAGHARLADREVDETSDIDLVDPVHYHRAKALLRRKKLWPVPRTWRALEAALVRRLGRPRGTKPRPPKPPRIRGSLAMAALVRQLQGPLRPTW